MLKILQYVSSLIVGGFICFRYLFPILEKLIKMKAEQIQRTKENKKWIDEYFKKSKSMYKERWIQKEDWEDQHKKE